MFGSENGDTIKKNCKKEDIMKKRTLISMLMIALLMVGFNQDALAQKKKKKKKKKGETEMPAKPIMKTDTSKVCTTYAVAEPNLGEVSEKFAYMWLRMQVGDMDGEYGALGNWEYVYDNAPGFSYMVYTNGSNIHREIAAKAKEEGDDAKFNKYISKAIDLLDEGRKCFPPGNDLIASYAYIEELKNPGEYEKILDLYLQHLDKNGNNTDAYSLISIARYAQYMGYLDKTTREEADATTAKAKAVTAANAGDKNYEYAAESIDGILEQYVEAYTEREAQAAATAEANNAAQSAGVYNEMLAAVEAGDMNTAKQKYSEYMAAEEDAERKYGIAMYLAGTLYGQQNYPDARTYYQQAASFDGSKGDPYYYIGLMYLSSGPQCGPGTGFDSQRVIWPATLIRLEKLA